MNTLISEFFLMDKQKPPIGIPVLVEWKSNMWFPEFGQRPQVLQLYNEAYFQGEGMFTSTSQIRRWAFINVPAEFP